MSFDDQAAPEADAVRQMMRERLTALGTPEAVVDQRRHWGMHRTRSIDYVVLLSGSLTLLLDEGEVEIKPLDVVIQRGTNHTWINRSSEPASRSNGFQPIPTRMAITPPRDWSS